jgi:hypothetical protein
MKYILQFGGIQIGYTSVLFSYALQCLTEGFLGASSEPVFNSFSPQRSNVTTFRPIGVWVFFEQYVSSFQCFDVLRNVVADEFMRTVYGIATKRQPDSPFLPDAIIDAATTLWSTTFAVFASTELFTPASTPLNATGFYSTEVSRLIVVSPIAYIILSVLILVALLNISLFIYASEKSILLEEPVGLASAAIILYRSDVNVIVAKLMEENNVDKIKKTLLQQEKLKKYRYWFKEELGRIIQEEAESESEGESESESKGFREWIGEIIYSNRVFDRFRTH